MSDSLGPVRRSFSPDTEFGVRMLIGKQLEAAIQQHRDELNRQLFSSGQYHAPIVLTWRDTLRRRVQRVRSYFVTLVDALRGRDPYDVDSDGY